MHGRVIASTALASALVSRRSSALQWLAPAVELSSPRADGHPTDTQSAGNVSVGELPGLEQPSSFQASFFTLTPGKVSWAPDHGHPL